MREKRSGIYVIERIKTGQKYVGQGIDVKRRMWLWHQECSYIYRALKKYNKENFKRYIIIYCEEWELTRLEIACIKIFHSHASEGGYNISWGGDAPMRGRNHSDRTKKIMSKAQSGKNHPLYGVYPSDETIKKIRIAISGKKNYLFGTKSKNSVSKYHGIVQAKCYYKDKIYFYWHARVNINGKRKHIKQCKIEEDAARAYDKYIVEHNLLNPLNFPEEWGIGK